MYLNDLQNSSIFMINKFSDNSEVYSKRDKKNAKISVQQLFKKNCIHLPQDVDLFWQRGSPLTLNVWKTID